MFSDGFPLHIWSLELSALAGLVSSGYFLSLSGRLPAHTTFTWLPRV